MWSQKIQILLFGIFWNLEGGVFLIGDWMTRWMLYTQNWRANCTLQIYIFRKILFCVVLVSELSRPLFFFFPFYSGWAVSALSGSRIQLFTTPRTVAQQASLFTWFSQQEYWNTGVFSARIPLPSPVTFRISREHIVMLTITFPIPSIMADT